jgi:hypothetical protein
MNQPDLPARQLAETLTSVEDIPLPDARPYATWGIAGGVPLVGVAVGAALMGLPDVVAYLFGLAGVGAVLGGVIAAGRQDERRVALAKAAIAGVPPEVLAHATLDHRLSEKTRILIAHHLNDTAPDWHTRLDSDHEDWQTLKSAGATLSTCFRSCGGGCAPKR